ncbi:MAG: hypothetical protein R3C19_18895 [Planctomycetaceae bacterium]
MNSRQYPFVTIFAATLLTVIPLCLVFLCAPASSSVESEVDKELSGDAQPSNHDDTGPLHDASVAALPPAKNADTWSTDNGSYDSDSESLAAMVASASVTRTTDIGRDYSEHTGSFSAMSPAEAMMTHIDEPEPAAADPVFDKPISEILTPRDTSPPALIGRRRPVTEFVDPVPEAPSYYDSTRHIAMADHARATANHADEKPAAKSPSRTDRSSGRRSRGSSKRDKDEKDKPAATDPVVVTEDETLEDVVLQTPLESNRVDRVENVVGVTRATGWPIALVRSDLPGDDWWVQQMVGINGNSFAARVNFGNEDSLSGSAYRMVIVFLDSPDEVRRFRIAKQFKELPKGTRHSREFFYVRK